MSELFVKLKEALKDKRFNELSLSGQTVCALYIWLIEKEDQGQRRHDVLYGCVIPSTFCNEGTWAITKGPSLRSVADGDLRKYRFQRLALFARFNNILKILDGLLDGLDLGQAASRFGYGSPRNPFDSVSLTRGPGRDCPDFVIRPYLFLETSRSAHAAHDSVRPFISPSGGPAHCISLTCLDKTAILGIGGRTIDPNGTVLKDALQHLSDEVGIDFFGTDAKRWGNIEILLPTSSDINANSQIHFRKSNPNLLSMSVKTTLDRQGDLLLVRCRSRSDHTIIFDECKELLLSGPLSNIEFNIGDEVDDAQITIWRRGDAGQWILWFEDIAYFVREISIAAGMVGATGRVESELFRPFIGSRAESTADALQRVTQVSYSISRVGGFQQHPFIPIERAFRDSIHELFPEPSGGGFFPKGWADQRSGLLGFIDWFINAISDSKNSRAILIDPYFDGVGVELFARARSRNTEFVVVTNAQVASDDDVPLAGESMEPARATRLKDAAKAFDFLLSALKFKVLDLRSVGGGRGALFHDRYLILEGSSADEMRGFHLSNSIQGATKRAPLLVTPISADILPDVTDYVRKLILADKSMVEAEVVTLVDTGLWRKDHARSKIEPDADAQSLLFSRFFGRQKGLSVEDSYESISEFLMDRISPIEFSDRWQSFAYWLAINSDGQGIIKALAKYAEQGLIAMIKDFILAAPTVSYPVGLGGSEADIETQSLVMKFSAQFPQAIEYAERLFDFPPRFIRPSSFPVSYATTLLALRAPVQAVVVLDELHFRLLQSTAENREFLDAVMNTLRACLAEVIEELYCEQDDLALALIGSNIALLRSLGALNILTAPFHEDTQRTLQTRLSMLAALPEGEYRQLLARWSYSLYSHQKPKCIGDLSIEDARSIVFQSMLQSIAASISREELKIIVDLASGPLGGSQANSISSKFVSPAVHEQKVDLSDAAAVWLELLFSKLSALRGAHENHQSSRHFYSGSCAELTCAAASWLAALQSQEQRAYYNRLNDMADGAIRVLRQPFSRSKDYTKWIEAYELALWIYIFVVTFIFEFQSKGTSVHSIQVFVGKAKDIREVLNSIQLPERSGERGPVPDLRGFRQYISSVAGASLASIGFGSV